MHSYLSFDKLYIIAQISKGVSVLTERISFIHAADLHLDSPFLGLANSPEKVYRAAQESTFKALKRLVEVAVEKDVDFILLVGDIFDEAIQSLKAHVKLRQAFEVLNKHHINVYMSFGNHDPIKSQKHYEAYPDNVFIFPKEQVTTFNFPIDLDPIVSIYGFSYEQRHIKRSKVEDFQRMNNDALFHIATMHGSLTGIGGHKTYAPFTLTDLLNKPFDYWALGHIHKRQILHKFPPIVYPGNLQGRHALESGEKGCYYVELTKSSSNLTFIPLHTIQFTNLNLFVKKDQSIFDMEQLIEQKIGKLFEIQVPLLIRLHLTGDEKLYEWEQFDYLNEIIELINERYLVQSNWRYIYEVTTSIEQIVQPNEQQIHFFQALEEEFSKTNITSFLTPLYEHSEARKFLRRLTTKDQQQINQKAKQLLINELLRSKR